MESQESKKASQGNPWFLVSASVLRPAEQGGDQSRVCRLGSHVFRPVHDRLHRKIVGEKLQRIVACVADAAWQRTP